MRETSPLGARRERGGGHISYLLEPIGLPELDNDVYLALVGASTADVATLVVAVGGTADAIEAAIGRLVEHGLVSRVGFASPRYRAISPEEAVPRLIDRRRRDLTELQRTLDELAAARRRRDQRDEVVERVTGQELVDVVTMLQSKAERELLIVDAPPYFSGLRHPNDGEFAAMARGVSYRVVYHPDSLGAQGAVDHMRRCVEAGEDARILADAGPKMVVADRSLAVVVESAVDPDPNVRLLVRSSTLLTLLLDHFERLWARAVPVDAVPEDVDAITARDRELLTLLAAGMKDRAIASTMGVTERTVGRRVTELMERLDAVTRFRAGVRAAQRGWITPTD